jgi:hypothetical protein
MYSGDCQEREECEKKICIFVFLRVIFKEFIVTKRKPKGKPKMQKYKVTAERHLSWTKTSFQPQGSIMMTQFNTLVR